VQLQLMKTSTDVATCTVWNFNKQEYFSHPQKV